MTYMRELADRMRDSLGDRLAMDGGDSLALLYALLAKTKGTAVTNEDVHDAFVTWCELRGRDHSTGVPFGDLSAETQDKDTPFAVAIRDVATSLDAT